MSGETLDLVGDLINATTACPVYALMSGSGRLIQLGELPEVDIPVDRDTVMFASNPNNQHWRLISASKSTRRISVWDSLSDQVLPTVLLYNFAAWLETKWGCRGAWSMVKEKTPSQLRGSNDCGAAVAYAMTLLGQGKPVSYDPKLLPALRQWIQGVIMYANLNPGPVTPEWYADIAEIRLHILDEKEYDRYQEAEENIRLVVCAGGVPDSGSTRLSLAGRGPPRGR